MAGTISEVLEAVSIIIASGTAVFGITAWRREMIGRRRAEVAEIALAKFYEAKDILMAARSPASFEGEGATRPPIPGETQADASYRNAIFAPAERLIKKSEFFSNFYASRYQFMSIFGLEAGRPFETIIRSRSNVIFSSQQLIRSHVDTATRAWNPNPHVDRNLHQQLEADIGWIDPENDEVGRRIDAAVQEMETLCRPVIAGRTLRDLRVICKEMFGRAVRRLKRNRGA